MISSAGTGCLCLLASQLVLRPQQEACQLQHHYGANYTGKHNHTSSLRSQDHEAFIPSTVVFEKWVSGRFENQTWICMKNLNWSPGNSKRLDRNALHAGSYQWLSARLQYLQCCSTGDIAVLHEAILSPLMVSLPADAETPQEVGWPAALWPCSICNVLALEILQSCTKPYCCLWWLVFQVVLRPLRKQASQQHFGANCHR